MRRNRWGVVAVPLLALAACEGGDAEEARPVSTTGSSRPSATTPTSLTTTTTTAASRSTACDPPEAGKDDEATATVFVYFYCEKPVFAQGTPSAEHLVALPRRVPHGKPVLRAALEELLIGTTVEEFNRGFQSFFFGPDTADLLIEAAINDDGVAVIDFSWDFAEIGNVSTAFTASAIHHSLEATVRQFPNVTVTFYRLEGDRLEWCRLIEPIGCPEL